MTDQPTARRRYVYHRVPEQLHGPTLYPLNQLRAVFPDLAAAQDAKYVGRGALCMRAIPHLNCLWNDVLMLSPVHPSKLRAALGAAGFTRFPARWFAVDVALLDPARTVIYVPPEQPPAGFALRAEDVSPFEPAVLDAFGNVSELQRRHYQQAQAAGNARPLLFSGTPHILYRGTLAVNQLRVIES